MTPTDRDLHDVLPGVWSLLADYARLIDDRKPLEWSRLFGHDGTLALPDRDISGEEGLVEFATGSARGVHVQGVPAVEQRADGTIVATSNFIYINAVTYTLSAGEYRDRIRVDGERCVFVRRQVVLRVRTADEPPAE